ncbi:hypothetical protein BN946_scf185013.g127 [Trametes cinnabarina]|uniref:Protein kinase domain-containing protein n=1 Tax=Pycnoporus cinnabarinus TaxID=5643 RepID=A0A060SG46_PYCCI|nr:hypothetical protein BN946_scf185013.g127 [Trametes cinnabarina]
MLSQPAVASSPLSLSRVVPCPLARSSSLPPSPVVLDDLLLPPSSPPISTRPINAAMSDDTRSMNTRARRQKHGRVLVISNPSPESSSDEGIPAPQEQRKPFIRPLPSPSRSAEAYYNDRYQHVPINPLHTHIPPLTTDIPYPSSRSNPSNGTLSSPSSSSSPAVESTPPPSTPGLTGSGIHLTDEGTIRQDTLKFAPPDRNDNIPQSSRHRLYDRVERAKSNVPGQGPVRRGSLSGSRPATSPTVSTPESYAPPAPYVPPAPHMFRSSPMEKVIVLVTTDAENLQIVDITGAMTPAFIRERIFTKLQIPDEDQAKYSIYRTEVGQFAIGEALTDEELFDLYKERGDHSGNLKLLVSHSSATVHEPLYEPVGTSTVNTIPPPVLPQQGLYAPLRPNPSTRLRQGSQSSASEAHHAEVGYEASVSEDDPGDADHLRDVREPVRPVIHARTLPTPGHRPMSPTGRQRSHSPGGMLSPEHTILRSSDSHPYRPEAFYPNVGLSPLPGTSPKSSRFVDGHPVHSNDPYSSNLPDHPADRERSHTNDGQPSSYSERQLAGRQMDERAVSDRERQRRKDAQRGDYRKESNPRNLKTAAYDMQDRRAREPWVIVPSDVPSSNNYKNDRPTTPQDSRRFPITPPSMPSMSALSLRPHTGSGAGSSESSRNKKSNKQVPMAWAVTWKHPVGPNTKSEQRPPQAGLMRGPKSMGNLREAYGRHPPSLQSGRPGAKAALPPLPPLTRPSTGGSSTGLPSSSSGDVSSATTEQAMSPDVIRSAPFPGYTRPIATSYTPSSSAANTPQFLSSPSQDPIPRPHSTVDDSSSSVHSQPRFFHSPQNSETSYEAASASRRHPSGPSHSYSTSGPSIHAAYGERDQPVHSNISQVSRPHVESRSEGPASVAEYPMRGPRTPPRSPVVAGGCAPNNPAESSMLAPNTPGAAFAQRGAIDEDSSSTVRVDDRTWFKGFIDENAAEGTMMNIGGGTMRPRPKPPMPPPTTQLPTPPLTDVSTFQSTVSTFKASSQYGGSDDSDNSEGRGTIWARPPTKSATSQTSNASQKPRSNTRPPLAPLSIESSPASTPNALPMSTSFQDYGRSPPVGFPAPPDFPPPTQVRTPKRTNAINKKQKDRISKFDNNFDVTWAPRPPPEVMYERLEEYFPEHDLDKPVIETPSGGTSPTTTEAPAVPAPQQKFKHKKSIRHVAAEHKRQLDRTSRGDESTVAPLSRKRNTKLWGSKLEEVTTEQGKGPASSAASDSSPGGSAKPIFRWVRGELIGKGTYGRVYLALNATTGEMIAVKQVEIPRTASDKNDSRQVSVVEALKLESETLKDLDHPNIVQYLGFEETPTFLSIFLEYVPGGSIASCLRKHGRFDEEVTKSFTGQILSGLEYLHSKGILHRDLKADNILVETSGVCKISDFGISKRTDDINMAAMYTSMQGTVFWMAPEVVNSKGKGYNSKIDIWSVGCVVFEMWTGQRPWSGQEAMAVLLHLYQTKQAPPVPAGIELSALADDFRLKCFAADPDLRPSAAELRRHPYLELQPGWTFNGFK